jgi:GNAT superfamily N-acetyltransferase
MSLLTLLSRKEKKLPKLENIRIENIGEIIHKEKPDKYERLIAGEKIPDTQRKAFRIEYEENDMNLDFVKDSFSGSLGFLDFRELKYSPNSEDWFQIYLGFMGVEPEHRKRGVGAELIKAVEKIAIERGATYIWGYVQGHIIQELFPFYNKLGYISERPIYHEQTVVSKHLR